MRCWTFRTRPLEIQREREAALLIEQLPETELLRLPLLLAHTLLPHSAPYSIHLYMTYNTIRRARCERRNNKTRFQNPSRGRVPRHPRLVSLGVAHVSNPSLALIWQPSSFFFPLEGQAGMRVMNVRFMVCVAASERSKLGEFKFDQSRLNPAEDLLWF